MNTLPRRWGEIQAGGKAARKENGFEDVQKIERSIAYMAQHLNQPVRVAELAAQANVSSSHFFVLFKRRTGCPPIDYFIRLRMRRARELLEAGSLHVKEVAAALGYEDPFYFSRMFKLVNHVAPIEYRKSAMRPRAAGRLPEPSGEISRTFDSAPRLNGASDYQFA